MTTRVYLNERSAKLAPVGAGKPREIIWGDWLEVEDTTPPSANWLVHWQGWNARTDTLFPQQYTIAKAKCRATPILEMIFLDVGQGDGCIVSVPDGQSQKVLIVDAGEGANMVNFLRWKTRGFRFGTAMHAAVITHSDMDHYLGFQTIFEKQAVSFEKIYHNGLVERAGTAPSGVIGTRSGGFCTEIIESRQQLETLITPAANRGDKKYPKLMFTALQDPARFGDIRMASTETGEKAGGRTYLPSFAPDAAKPTIEILGPIADKAGNQLRLREFGEKPGDGGFNLGKTKNGHSVILKLEWGALRVIFGGDLNRPAEDHLLRHYSGIAETAPLASAVPAASARLEADLLKCCHHGAADVTDEFVEAVNPFAFVVSSGDEETHVHPRPDLLGLLGKKGRGNRPLILCTELLRSTPESKTMTPADKAKVRKLADELRAATTSAQETAARRALNDFWNEQFRRLVNVYGAITIRSDGQKLLVAFREESGPAWKFYEYAHAAAGWSGGDVSSGAH